MLKKIILIAVAVIALVGCDEQVSGKFSGTWEYEKGQHYGKVIIKESGDHYNLREISQLMQVDRELTALEVDGKYLKDSESGLLLYTFIDDDHMRLGASGGIYVKVQKAP